MWVFGYGSLMWDGWEKQFDCREVVLATVQGYGRAFNKASVERWGTKLNPGPTLNLISGVDLNCTGSAFSFSEGNVTAVLVYLRKREGGFDFPTVQANLADGRTVEAITPVYAGKNLIVGQTPERVAEMIVAAKGGGNCVDYVRNIAAKLVALGIEDQAVFGTLTKVDALAGN
jgi:cation transport protein ChaC